MSRQVWKGSTLLNPEPPVLVSCGAPEKPNLITVGWTGTICTQPPMLSISVRPERYSHHLIKESGEFVVNLPTESLVRAIDWCGVKSGRDVDKFAAMHLTAVPAAKVGTVLVEESPVNLLRIFRSFLMRSSWISTAPIIIPLTAIFTSMEIWIWRRSFVLLMRNICLPLMRWMWILRLKSRLPFPR